MLLYTRPTFLTQPQPEVKMREKLSNELPDLTVTNADWTVWSKILTDSGGVLTRMNTWEQFKESCRQAIYPTIQLDETNRVVWFKGSFTQAVYYEY